MATMDMDGSRHKRTVCFSGFVGGMRPFGAEINRAKNFCNEYTMLLLLSSSSSSLPGLSTTIECQTITFCAPF